MPGPSTLSSIPPELLDAERLHAQHRANAATNAASYARAFNAGVPGGAPPPPPGARRA